MGFNLSERIGKCTSVLAILEFIVQKQGFEGTLYLYKTVGTDQTKIRINLT